MVHEFSGISTIHEMLNFSWVLHIRNTDNSWLFHGFAIGSVIAGILNDQIFK